jgi:hemoglobin
MRVHARTLASSLALAAWLATTPASAQRVQPPVTGPEEAALFQALGQREGLGQLTDIFVDRVLADPRIGHFFKGIRPAHLKKQIPDFICLQLGGGCAYEGDSMRQSHADLKIGRADFLRVVELLQDSMDARGIPFAVQNRLLARLAPMHRDIITR